METKRLYYEDPYMKKFESKIIAVPNECELALESTLFYPEAGGQPSDKGALHLSGSVYNVVEVRKCNGTIYHKLDKDLPGEVIGKPVYGQIDWKTRYTFMRQHTALHILNAFMLKMFDARVTGAQIGEQCSRMDFQLARGLTPAERKELEDSVNAIIAESRPVKIRYVSDTEAMTIPDLKRTLNKNIPKTNDLMRIVEIENFDTQACGGLHVNKTDEVGQLKIQKIDNKGHDNRRIKTVLL